ncbi:MAG: hypothetical protein IID32_03930 [Planctomycetes bacterium]|nr:hypothetical protein [Planctomycetota bacterium]
MSSGMVSTLSDNADIRHRRRDELDLLISRMGLLKAKDRTLLDMQIRHACSYRQLSRLSGLSEEQVSRRNKALIRRLTGHEYITIYRHKECFSETQLLVAYDRYLLGLGYRKIAAKHELEEYPVRRILSELKAFLDQCFSTTN